MNACIGWLKQNCFQKDLNYRIRIFDMLALIGAVMGFLFALVGTLVGAGILNVLANLLASILAIFLFLFAHRTGRFQRCFLITVFAVFITLFPIIFFTGGGYRSGMPAFFVFAAAFTVLMLEGAKRMVVTILELALYLGICLIAYFYPETVTAFSTEKDAAADIIAGSLAASAALAIAIGLHIKVYDHKQKRLERFDREKTELFGNISHEMKTPLAAISCVAHAMREKYEKLPEAQGAVSDALLIATEADRLALLVSQVLELTRIEEGRMVRDKKPVYIDEIIHGAMAAHFVSSINGNRIDIKIGDNLPPVLADAPRLTQVIVNLVANAERHTRNGHILIWACRQDEWLAVSVSDNGEGMDKERLSLIFERYYTGAGDTGTGLGLYICKHIVEAHGGRISAFSHPGEGARLTFTLPVCAED